MDRALTARDGGIPGGPGPPYGPAGLAAEYAAKADAYARVWAPVLRPLAMPMLDEVPLTGAGAVLDLGAGTGEMLPALRARAPGARLIAADRSAGMLRRAGGADACLACDALHLPLDDASVDAAVLVFVLFHLPDPVAGLRECLRVLRRGGALGVVTWGVDAEVPGTALWAGVLDAAGAAPDPRDPSLMQHAWMDTPGKLAALLDVAGFARVHARAARFEHPCTVPDLMEIHVEVGAAGRRLASLSPEGRAASLARAADRLQGLPADARVYRPEVVWAVAVRP